MSKLLDLPILGTELSSQNIHKTRKTQCQAHYTHELRSAKQHKPGGDAGIFRLRVGRLRHPPPPSRPRMLRESPSTVSDTQGCRNVKKLIFSVLQVRGRNDSPSCLPRGPCWGASANHCRRRTTWSAMAHGRMTARPDSCIFLLREGAAH